MPFLLTFPFLFPFEHVILFDHVIDWANSRILKTESNFSKRLTAESWFIPEVGTAPLFSSGASSGATSAAVFLIAEAEAPLLFSANSEKRQRRYI